ncbi:hypothetical protein BG842_05320 [Haladaptatus sp. W1]|uniref:HAF repeat-containing protein n=1 Tax=Haladaptatus sp. W1 TaxID=1897478 RepID=UPI0008498090|nr:HAF repeat-containing protein [Haladaptatus sp. W1]ODR81278.1 hypothetical protein BG842_05320 [Haladaptatus sp. W1]
MIGSSSQNTPPSETKPDAAYSRTDLGTLGGVESTATSISRGGYIAGFSQRDDLVPHAFLWSKAEGMQDLGTLSDSVSRATDINSHCTVVGSSVVTEYIETEYFGRVERHPSHAFQWSENGGMRDIGSSSFDSEATAINERGDIVGTRHYWGTDTTEGFVKWGDGEWDAPLKSSRYFLAPTDINTHGQIVGMTMTEEGQERGPFIWSEADGKRDIGTLGGNHSEATAINDNCQVVGASSTDPWNGLRAFLWTADNAMRNLGTLGGTYSKATDINNCGQVVGVSQTADGTVHAFIWSEDDGMRDLGTLGGNYSTAAGINDRGQVAGSSRTADGYPHATIWNPE